MSVVSSLATGQRQVAQLEFNQDEVDGLKRKLLELTEATITVRVGRDKEGRIEYGTVPDVGIRLAATAKALEFAVGKPKQMMELQTGPRAPGSVNSQQGLAKLLAANPDIAARILSAITDGINVAQAIDVTPASASQAPRPPE